MSELELHRWLCWGLIGMGLLTFVSLQFMTAAYGRHRKDREAFCCSNRAGWIIMEFPAVVGFLGVLALGQYTQNPAVWVLCGLWMLHYGYRTLIYPFRIRYVPRRMPLEIALTGFCFQALNAYLNARWISQLHHYEMSWLTDWRFVLGAILFVVSFAGNFWSDEILLRLKREAPDRYQIPRGGPYRWISSPNYAFELVEWGAWALLTWSMPGLAFFLYAIANLGPRAMTHHRWYKDEFPDYPPERKALIPGVL